MKEIKLTQGKYALVDEEDYKELIKYKWHAIKKPTSFYVGRESSRKDGPQRIIFMHRHIMKPSKDKFIDHIDGDGLNNQKHNLRIATKAQNRYNSRPQKSLVPYKGVRLDRHHRYEAKIRNKYVGYYNSAVCAALAYDKKAKELFGEFARLNFPESWYES